MPSVRGSRFHRQRRNSSRKHDALVRCRLSQKDFLARHGNHTGGDTFRGKLLGRIDTRSHLRATGYQNQVRVLRLDSNIPSFAGQLDRRNLQSLGRSARATNDGWRLVACQGNMVRTSSFVRVRRTVHVDVRHGSKTFQGFNRLMSWTILAQANGIVRHDEQDRELTQSRKADRTYAVADKDQKGRTVGAETTVSKDTVGNSNHTMLTNTETQVPSHVGVLLEVDYILVVRQV
mmetsp:Transcript_17555/g.44785  ORF Transcript_17555/g.44785 Transcript_17555/m.44785 type:complete len:233 (+) Transcript_17555:329-1027(+)